MDYTQLSIETLDRVQERFLETLGQVSVEKANVMPTPLIKSITWLIWHTSRMIDLQISELKGEESLWIADCWTEKFNLPLPDDTLDFKHSPEHAEKVKISDKDLLVDYLDAATKLAKDYLSHLDESTLYEIIDENYTPAVTRHTRIVSIIDDAVMHSGQAIYTRRMVIGK
ncbi:DinB family protein [Aerococcus urinaeequi]|uniref:DinB family protein n=1 Tax=Aerococcus urinaeequi TaxID=51665 RepID=UPI0022E045BC|nr:DinB family protein [Aerococcus urinaeequi]